MATSLSQDELRRYLAQHYPSYKELWCTLLPGSTSTEALLLRERMQYEQLLMYFSQQHLVSRFLDQERSLLYAEYTTATYPPPFTLRLEFARLSHVPSSVALMLSLAAFAAYNTLAGPAPFSLQWLFDETPFSYKQRIEESAEIPLAVISLCDGSGWPDFLPFHSPVIALGCKGSLQVELQVQTASSPLPLSYGAILPNAAWRLLWALTSLKNAQEDILIEGFYDALQPLEDDETALLAAYPATKEYLSQQWHTSVLMNLSSFQQHYAHLLTPTCSVTTIHSGQANEPALPESATARVDFQLLPAQNPYHLLSSLRKHLDERSFQDIQLHPLYMQSPLKTSLSAPIAQQLSQTLNECYAQPPLLLPFVSGPCPTAYLKQPSASIVVLPFWDGAYTDYPTEAQFIHAASYWASLFNAIAHKLLNHPSAP